MSAANATASKRSRGVRIARIARRVAIGLLLGSVLLLLFAAWLLRSGGGRDFALQRVLAALPADSLSWQRAEGSVSGPLVLHGVRYVHEGLVVEVERAEIDLAPLALVGRTVHLEAVTLERGRVVLPPGDSAPQPWPRRIELPSTLPEFQLGLTVALDALRLSAIRFEQDELALLDLQRMDAAGRFERGRLALTRFELDSDRARVRASGALDTAQRWDTGLQASVDLIGIGTESLPLALDARGNWSDLTLIARTALPAPASATLRVFGGLPDPQWQLRVDAPELNPKRLGFDADVLSVSGHGEGDLGRATLQADVVQGTRRWRLEPSALRLDDGMLHVEPVAVALDPGRIEARGSIDLREAEPRFALDIVADQLVLPGTQPDIVTLQGQGRFEGPASAYTAHLDATLRRDAETAQLTARGQGDTEGFDLAPLTLTSARGGLEATGRVAWSPQPSWDIQATLRRFDPSWLAPGFPGAVDARVTSRGSVGEHATQGEFRADPLGGELRGRALSGQLSANWQEDGSGRGAANVRLGASHLEAQGQWGEAMQADLTLSPLHLDDLWPAAQGALRGQVTLRGSRDAPTWTASVEGGALAFDAWRAESLRLTAQLERGEQGQVDLQARGLDFDGHRFERLDLHAEGTRAQHRGTLTLSGGPVDLDLALQGSEHDGQWREALQQLRVTPKERSAWALRAPAEFRFDARSDRLQLSEACLMSDGASLCAQADWSPQRGEARATLDALPLATLDPFLAAELEMPAAAFGVVSGQARFARGAPGEMQGEVRLSSSQGGLRLDPEAPRDWLVYRDLTLEAQFDPAAATLTAASRLGAEGEFSLSLRSEQPLQDDGALGGQARARLRDLTFLELLDDTLVAPKGEFDAELTLAGTRRAPTLTGTADLRKFTSEVPALGLRLSEGRLALRGAAGGAADIEGAVRSGAGELRIAGRFDPAQEERLSLTLRGENVTAAAIPEASVVISPDVSLRWQAERVRLRGAIAIPKARIELERLQSATRPSSDVVIVDAGTAAQDSATQLDSDIELVLGEDVRLTGFGLKGKLEGKLGLRDRPGRASVARGGVQVGGEYKAYGQDLRITRGRLSYASTPLDNPALDVRAEREIDDVTVGVQVRGTALAPELTLWSKPALDQAEQLSYLVLGRPLRSASQADGAQLSQAAAAFGGNLLAQKLGARLGLDEVGVADSRALGGAALTVGKYLSPKLYVSYGMALFGPGQVVTFKYLLNRIWSLQIDSGTENRAAINYRLER